MLLQATKLKVFNISFAKSCYLIFFNPLCLTCQNAADYNFKSNESDNETLLFAYQEKNDGNANYPHKKGCG